MPSRTAMDGSAPRGLPHSWEMERAVLGGLMVDATLYPEVAEVLRDEDFSKPAHARLFVLMGQLHRRDQSCGLISVLDALEGSPALETCGGAAYVVGMGQAGSVDTTVAEAKQVRRHADHRRLIAALQDGVEDAYRAEDEDVVGSVSDRAVAAIAAVRDGAMAKVTYATPLADIDELGREMDAAIRNPGKAVGLPIDLVDLEQILIGWIAGKFYLFAARPAMGKTALAEEMAIHLARRGFPVGFFSMEMPRKELTMRGACMLERVDSVKILKGVGDAGDVRRYVTGLEDMGRLPLYVDDTPGLSIGEFSARARRMVKKDGVRAIFVDYIQLMKDPAALKRGNREQEMTSISQGMKGLAKSLDIPIIALGQLNRALEARANKRPMPSDLRESGSLEQDADLIGFIYRDEVYNPDTADRGIAEVIIAKSRYGPTGTAKLAYIPQFTLFQNYAGGPDYR